VKSQSASLVILIASAFGPAAIMSPCEAESLLNSLRVVAISGQQVPGAPAGTLFSTFGKPVINNAGEVAFSAFAVSSAGATHAGIWTDAGGTLDVAALEEAQPPGFSLPDVFANAFAFNDRGETVFRAPGGIWRKWKNSLELIVPEGVAVTVDSHSQSFTAVGRPAITRDGLLSFAADHGSSTSQYVGMNGNFAEIANDHDTLPGTFTYPQINLLAPAVVNSDQHAAFWAGLYDASVWTNTRGQLEQLARTTNFPEPGEVRYGQTRSPVITTQGDVVFFAQKGQLDILSGVGETLLRLNTAGLSPIVSAGDQAPGLAPGVVFSNLFDSLTGPITRPIFDDQGDLVFRPTLRGPESDYPGRQSIWRVHKDQLQLVVEAGSHAPGADVDDDFWRFSWPLMNNRGQIAFSAQMTGPLHSFNDDGIWAQDIFGNLRLIAREGDYVDLSGGANTDVRRIANLSLLAANGGRGPGDLPYAFNNAGEIAFQITFYDQSQAIVVSNLLAVPEPTAGWFVFLIAALCLVEYRSLRQR
jgi:hypothetical protein